jgi:hypothetical protein
MTWRPSVVVVRRPSSSSVSKARFVTAGAISMKLGVRIPLVIRPQLFFYFRDLTYFMGGVSNKTTSHVTRVLDLTYFSR